ncbi:hypothetical protein Q3G72_009214 [Acer saccharum]|nr:hypothetical protein Q3G72_009214 [Acer saccharum]
MLKTQMNPFDARCLSFDVIFRSSSVVVRHRLSALAARCSSLIAPCCLLFTAICVVIQRSLFSCRLVVFSTSNWTLRRLIVIGIQGERGPK